MSGLLLPVGPAVSQVVRCDPAACMTTVASNYKTCTHMWAYGGSMGAYGGIMTASAMTVGGATQCTLMLTGTATFYAKRPVANPVGTCSWTGSFSGAGGLFPFVCVIDSSDGLPVELLEFSVDGAEETVTRHDAQAAERGK